MLFALLFIPIMSVSAIDKVSCGNVTHIPAKIPELVSFAITLVQIAVPVILVIMGSLDLFKGITANKEDEIKKGQQIFIKRLIVAALIFFVIAITKLLISVVDSSSSDNITECIDCFFNSKKCRYEESEKEKKTQQNEKIEEIQKTQQSEKIGR